MEIHILYLHKDRLTCMYTKIPSGRSPFQFLQCRVGKAVEGNDYPRCWLLQVVNYLNKLQISIQCPANHPKGTFKGVIIVIWTFFFELVWDMRLTCQHVLGQAFKTSEEALWADFKGSFEICQDVRMFTFSLNSIHDIFRAPPTRHDEMQKNVLRKWVERAWDSYAFARFCHLHCLDHLVTCVPWNQTRPFQTRPVFKECLKTWNEILI